MKKMMGRAPPSSAIKPKLHINGRNYLKKRRKDYMSMYDMKENDVKIMIELFDDLNTTTKDLMSLASECRPLVTLCKEQGYEMCRSAANEFYVYRKDSSFHITCWNMFGKELTFLDTHDYLPDIGYTDSRIAVGCSSPNIFYLDEFFQFRQRFPGMSSICTRSMPKAILTVLRYHFGITDNECLIAFTGRLMRFGTKGFWKDKGFLYKDPMWFGHTRDFICYTTGELEAIAKISAEMMKDVSTPEEVAALNMKAFSDKLAKETEDCAPTFDMGLFGRWDNGCGLKELDSSVQVAVPIEV